MLDTPPFMVVVTFYYKDFAAMLLLEKKTAFT